MGIEELRATHGGKTLEVPAPTPERRLYDKLAAFENLYYMAQSAGDYDSNPLIAAASHRQFLGVLGEAQDFIVGAGSTATDTEALALLGQAVNENAARGILII